ncbi:hypothetical protein OEZ85_005279 [Tetradesmus obliquus]|uniref:Glycosyltransferase 2-like domain-containing protein n=1 Tax=Tetradesmus obliquus TaxID=3088 RepID=A0ABY8UHC8_TETOB|nr:hypothetical protein OEZ85_005279 [Tetradesmus obliquus]
MGMLNPANWFAKKQAPPAGPRPSALQVAASRMPERVVWAPRKAPRPTKLHFSPLALLLLLAFLGAAGYYFYVRVAFTLNMGSHTWYGVLVLVVEIIGLTAVVPYGMLLPFHTLSSGSKGLPVDDGRAILPPEKRFRVHILVPCYKESLEVITNTVTAALAAEVPPGVTRVLYLCDDGKDPQKADFIASLADEAQYVSGRSRAPGEINGKSANLNNCLRNVIFKEYEGRAAEIPARELVVVFDADMAARRHFLLKVLEAMWDDSISLCLTPQAFSNINPGSDIFNNINQQFWQYVLPGCDALGYIACTGTNFCLRARSLAAVGWFPEYTITEDYALSMELKSAGFKGTYLNEYLAVGEAPDEIRNVCRQRSRWTKGHMQIFFSRRCPLLNWKLPLVHKILYTNGTWAYFCTILTTLVFLFVPFNSLVFGYHPVAFSYEFAVAATVYLPLNFALMNFVRTPRHLKGQWMASVSNHILTFTYMKAVANTLLSIVGVKAKAGFKATDKSGGANPISAIKNLGSNLISSMSRAGSSGLPTTSQQSGVVASPLSAAAAAMAGGQRVVPASAWCLPAAMAGGQRVVPARPPPMSSKVVVGADGRPRVLPPRPMTKSELIQAELKQQQAAQKKPRRGCWVWINAKTLEGALDPLFLAFSLCVSLAALAAGIWTVIRSSAFSGITVSSWDDFTQIFTSGRLDVYLLVPMLWALYNALPPLLFFVYFFTKGRLLQGLCSFAQVFGLILAAVAVASLWLGMLVPYTGVTDAPVFSDIQASFNSALAKTLSNVPHMPPSSPARP